MKKALIITYYWPPSGGAGVQRWLKTVKYLRNFGWEPIVYTPENPEAPVLDTSLEGDIPEGLTVIKQPIWEPYQYYKKLVGLKSGDKINAGFIDEKKKPARAESFAVWLRGNLFIPDARKYWIKPSIKFMVKYLKENPVDVIVSTGPPHSMHLIAYGIKKRLGIPWLADFRDPWTGIDFYDQLKLTKWADKKHHRLEQLVLEQADKVTAISWNMASDFFQLHEREYRVITNGFDPADFPGLKGELNNTFELTHIGSLNKDRNPETLWQVLAEICGENPSFSSDLHLRFIGKCDLALYASLAKFGLMDKTQKIEYLPHDDVVQEACKSQVLLLFLNDAPNVMGIVPGKMFEYLASRRPIFCIGPAKSDGERVLTESRAGVTCGFEDHETQKREILRLYDLFKSGKLVAQDSEIEKFSRVALTKSIAAVLDEIAG